MPESVPEDEIREHRIVMEIIVDCYNEEERAMGWYYYLEDQIKFPFQARCLSKRNISPLKYGEVIMVIAMGPEEECDHEIFVEVEYQEESLSVPLSQLEGLEIDEVSSEAIKDWHYWVGRGYHF
jgi:hypothetical protein